MKELRFDGRVAIITGVGNTQGLGFAYAKLLGERGAKIVANSRSITDETVSQLKESGIDIIAVPGDGAKIADAQRIAETALSVYGRIDILINNAGVCKNVTLDEESEELFDQILKANIYGTRNMCKAVLPYMMEHKYGRIINTTSSAGMYGLADCFAYSASKGAVYGCTRSLSLWGKDHGIVVNAIAPSAATMMALSDAGMDEEVRQTMLRVMSPDAVAPVIAVLAHESCPVTGRVIESAGGGTGEIFVGTTPGIMSAHNTPEFIVEHWDRMRDKAGYEIVDDVLAMDSIVRKRLTIEM